MSVLKNLKVSLIIKYKIKDLGEIKIIIGWQIIRDLAIRTIRVSQFAYIKNLLEEKNFTNCNTPTILMKAGSSIEMSKLYDYDKANLRKY